MDAHRLRSVLDRVVGEHGRLGIDSKIAQVIQAMGRCTTDPGGPADEELRGALSELFSALRQARTNDFVESDRRILVEIEGERHTGNGLAERLDALTNEQPFLPGRAKERLVEIADDLQRFLGICAAAQAALEKLNVASPAFDAEHFELGILLPDELLQGDLDRVLEELKGWNAALRDLVPIVSERKPAVVLRTHTTRRFELAAALDGRAALALGTVITGLYRMFLRIRANRERAGDLERQHYPPELVRRMKDYEQHLVPQAMAEVRKEFESRFVQAGAMKPKELERTLDRALRFMATRIREGVELELIGPQSVDTSAPGEQADRSLPHHVRQAMQAAVRAAASKAAPASDPTGGAMKPRDDEQPAQHMPLSVITGIEERGNRAA